VMVSPPASLFRLTENEALLLYLVIATGRLHWSAYALIAGPLFLVGVLFLLNWRFRAELRSS
jgi:hypothetical protein